MGSVWTLPGRREAGVTLIEALVVLAILGLVTAVVTVPINSYWQRSRLQSAAGDIRNFLQLAYVEAVNQHTAITVTLSKASTDAPWTLQLNPPPAGTRAALGTYVVPDFVSFAYNSAAAANPGAAPTGWPSQGSGPDAPRSLACDTMSRTLCPIGLVSCETSIDSAQQVTDVRTLSITHARMVDGSLSPNTRFDIVIYPMWSVSYQKVILP